MHVLDNTMEYERCEGSTHAGNGFRRKALPISLPALVLGMFVHVISDTDDWGVP